MIVGDDVLIDVLFFELRSSLQPKLDRQSLLAHLVLRFLQKSASAIYAGHSVASARELQRMPFGSTSHIADRLPRLQTKQLFNAIDLPRTLPLVWKLKDVSELSSRRIRRFNAPHSRYKGTGNQRTIPHSMPKFRSELARSWAHNLDPTTQVPSSDTSRIAGTMDERQA